MKKILVVIFICLLCGLVGNDMNIVCDVDYVIHLEMNNLYTITKDDFNRMTKDEYINWGIFYICTIEFATINDSTYFNFGERNLTISKNKFLEKLCQKLLPKWILEREDN